MHTLRASSRPFFVIRQLNSGINAFKWVCIVAVVFALVSCSTTRTIAEWRDQSVNQRYENILIIGVSKQTILRRLFEETFVNKLMQMNVNATTSVSIMPSEEKISKQTVKAAIQGKGFDGVLVTHLLGVEDKEVYHPPRYRPIRLPYYRHYYGYYSRVFDYVYEPGYYQRYKIVKLETNLYDTDTEEIVWSTQSSTIDGDEPEHVINSVIKKSLKMLQKQRLI